MVSWWEDQVRPSICSVTGGKIYQVIPALGADCVENRDTTICVLLRS